MLAVTFAALTAVNVVLGTLFAVFVARRARRIAAEAEFDALVSQFGAEGTSPTVETASRPPGGDTDAAQAATLAQPSESDEASRVLASSLSSSWLAVAKRDGQPLDRPVAVALAALADEVRQCLASVAVGRGESEDEGGETGATRTTPSSAIEIDDVRRVMGEISQRLTAHRTKLDHAFRKLAEMPKSIGDVIRTLTFEMTWIAEQVMLLDEPDPDDPEATPAAVLTELEDHLLHLESETLDRLEASAEASSPDDASVDTTRPEVAAQDSQASERVEAERDTVSAPRSDEPASAGTEDGRADDAMPPWETAGVTSDAGEWGGERPTPNGPPVILTSDELVIEEEALT